MVSVLHLCSQCSDQWEELGGVEVLGAVEEMGGVFCRNQHAPPYMDSGGLGVQSADGRRAADR